MTTNLTRRPVSIDAWFLYVEKPKNSPDVLDFGT